MFLLSREVPSLKSPGKERSENPQTHQLVRRPVWAESPVRFVLLDIHINLFVNRQSMEGMLIMMYVVTSGRC